MGKILIRGGKTNRHAPFRPSIILRDTPYSPGHWQGLFFRPGVWCGMKTTAQMTVSEIVPYYLSELKRMGHFVAEVS